MAFAASTHLTHKDLLLSRVELNHGTSYAILCKNVGRGLLLIVSRGDNCGNYEIHVHLWVNIAQEGTLDEAGGLHQNWVLVG